MTEKPDHTKFGHRHNLSGLARKYAGLTVGLYGGSFNPAHAGHGHVARAALNHLKLDSLWMMVSPGNPLKNNAGDMASDVTRTKSLLPYSKHPKIIISDVEQILGTSYSVDTIEKLIKIMPLTNFIWIIGADNLVNFHLWKRWRDIAHMLPIAVFDRPMYSTKALHSRYANEFNRFRLPKNQLLSGQIRGRTPKRCLPAWSFITIPRHPASSTNIRRTMKQNK